LVSQKEGRYMCKRISNGPKYMYICNCNVNSKVYSLTLYPCLFNKFIFIFMYLHLSTRVWFHKWILLLLRYTDLLDLTVFTNLRATYENCDNDFSRLKVFYYWKVIDRSDSTMLSGTETLVLWTIPTENIHSLGTVGISDKYETTISQSTSTIRHTLTADIHIFTVLIF